MTARGALERIPIEVMGKKTEKQIKKTKDRVIWFHFAAFLHFRAAARKHHTRVSGVRAAPPAVRILRIQIHVSLSTFAKDHFQLVLIPIPHK